MGFFGNNNSSDDSDPNNIYSQMKSNRSSSIIILIVIIIAYLAYTTFFQNSTACNGPTSTGRTMLSSELCGVTNFTFGSSDYTSKSDYQEEMVNFYNASGVQPVLYDLTGEAELTQNELQEFADNFYENELFTDAEVNDKYDEGHFLIVFQAASDGKSYKVAYHVGTDAATVIDDAAIGTFSSILSEKFASCSAEDLFETVFKNATSQIMGTSRSSTIIIIAVVVILVVYMGFNFMKNYRKKNSSTGDNN